jgi:benzylsuccinate CoA-transferase BbsE subunit
MHHPANTRATDASPQSAFEGLRVLDLAGPMGVFCGKLFADLGADVIRIEPPAGDATRRLPPFYQDEPGIENSLFHWHFNTSKRSITLDLARSDGQELFRKLVRTSDIVVETFPPGHLDSLALGFGSLAEVKPDIILTSITPFGQTGPYKDYVGEELIGQAAGGLLWMCGWPDREPVMMGGWPALHQASAEAAAGTLLALEYRDLTGQGQQVDVSIQASMPLTLMTSIPEYHKLGVMRRPREGDGHTSAINGLFACADGYADFRFRGRPGQWDQLVAWLDSVGMAEDLKEERWRDPDYRLAAENYPHIDEVFQRFIIRYTREDAVDRAQRIGIPSGAVYTVEDLLREPQLQAREYFVELEHPELRRSFIYPGAPYRLSETPWQLRRRAPLLGEHNLDVYQTELGLSPADIAALRAAHVI